MDEKIAEPTQARPAPGSSIPPGELEQLTADIVAALKTVYDPEIPADIYELGLIYKIDVDDSRNIAIDMTLTSPGCPVAGEMPGGATARPAVQAARLRPDGAAGLHPAAAHPAGVDGAEGGGGEGDKQPRMLGDCLGDAFAAG